MGILNGGEFVSTGIPDFSGHALRTYIRGPRLYMRIPTLLFGRLPNMGSRIGRTSAKIFMAKITAN
jgi:hypothetical protein